jgi:hypothetical protein
MSITRFGRFLASMLGLLALSGPAAAQTFNGIYFSSPQGDYIGQGETRTLLAPPNTLTVSRNFDNGVSFDLDVATPLEFWNLEFAAPGNAEIAPGAYEAATRFPFQASTEPGLNLSGAGRGCNTLAGRFVVHEATYATDGTVLTFAADFEQRCEVIGPTLIGSVRYNSNYGFVTTPATPPRLVNIATRAQVLTGDDVLIGGFIVGGTSNKTIMVRARGPSLLAAGITNPLLNPTLMLLRSSDNAVLATNDDWGQAGNYLAIDWSGYKPPHEKESAVLISLAPGAYTAIVSGVSGTQGVALVEVFEVAQATTPLLNISSRGKVLTGDNVMIAGLIIQGGPQAVVLRARGPSLAAFGIIDVLANPTITLVNSADQSVVATNDDWGSASNAAAISSSGFAPSDPSEAAILISLNPGAYTAIVSGVGGTTGVAIVEAFAN